jgi:putative heme iron utilization protein
MEEQKEVKLCRLRDVSLHILELATEKTDRESYDTLELIDHDIMVYIKNFVQFCEDMGINPTITFVGDNDKSKKAVVTG